MCGIVDDYNDYTINFLYQFKNKVGIEKVLKQEMNDKIIA